METIDAQSILKTDMSLLTMGNPTELKQESGDFYCHECGTPSAVSCQIAHLLPRELLTQGKLPQNSMSVLGGAQPVVFTERVIRLRQMGNS